MYTLTHKHTASGSMQPSRRTKSESDAKPPTVTAAAETARGRKDSQSSTSEDPPNTRKPPEVWNVHLVHYSICGG